MSAISVDIKIKGHEVTAINESLKIAKTMEKAVQVKTEDGIWLTISPESYLPDLNQILFLQRQINSYKKES